MTASPARPPVAARRPTPLPDGWTTAGAGVGLGCTLVGQFVETPWRSGSDAWGTDFHGNGGWGGLVLLVAFVAVAALVAGFVAVRARTAPPARTARVALVLAALGAVSVLVFWTGVPAVLAGAATGLALDARRRLGRLPAAAAAGLTLAVLTVAAAVWLAFTG
ncbi:hypothetical protein ACI8AV_22630 [Geodermatophilus sp. SYSU D00804]